MKKFLLLFSLCTLISGMAFAQGVTVNFPSDTTWYSTANNGADFMGNNSGMSAPMYTAGDYISETFVTGLSAVYGLTVDWSVLDYFGGNPGNSYENDIYINGAFVASFLVDDCGFCNSIEPIGGTVTFNPINGVGADGTSYTISVVLAQTAPSGGGAEQFTELNAAGGPATAFLATPEPTSMALFGSGMLGLAGILRRKLSL